jgi:tetratricopeptide (TPR) repeat protein
MTMTTRNHLNSNRLKKAQRLLAAGNLSEARPIYEKLCRSGKNNTDVCLTLAVINRKMGFLREAEAICARTISLQPENALAYHIAGSVQECLGNLDAAITNYKYALRIDPSLTEAYYFLGNAFRSRGFFDEAVKSYREAIKLQPDYLEALSNLGAVLVGLHRLKEARLILEKANRIHSGCEQVLCNLGDLYLLEDNIEQASNCASAVLRINPRFSDGHYLAAKIYRKKGDYDSALQSYRAALEIKPGDENLIGSIAEIYEIRGEFEEASELLAPLIERGTRAPLALLAYSSLVNDQSEIYKAIDLIETNLTRSGIEITHLIGMHYQLGRHYEMLQKYTKAFSHYKKANKLERDLNKHIEAHIDASFTPSNVISDWYERFDFKFWQSLSRSKTNSSRPVFVVGMPRSGTTLAEQILASHPLVHGAGELTAIANLAHRLGDHIRSSNRFHYLSNLDQQEITDAAEKYLGVLDSISSKACRVIDKMPTNFWHIGLISLMFPDVRVIHMKRDPRDVCLSMYCQRFGASMTFTTDLKELASYYAAYSKVMEYWGTVLEIEVMNVNYEDLVGDQEKVTRQMIEYCGLEWDNKCLRFYQTDRDVNTPSYNQVRLPMYTSSVGRWKHYIAELEPLTTALGLQAA